MEIKFKDILEDVRNLVVELDPECPDSGAYIDGHCSLYDLVMSKMKGGAGQRKVQFKQFRKVEEGSTTPSFNLDNALNTFINNLKQPHEFMFVDLKELSDKYVLVYLYKGV